MARSTVLISDLTGAVIDGLAAEVSIKLSSKPGVTYRLDVDESEIENLLGHARETKRRGRPKKK